VIQRSLVPAILVALMTAGCVPKIEPDIPELTGFVTRSHAPVQGATILVTERWTRTPCTSARPVAKTDHLGRFHYEGKRRLHFAVLAGDPRPHWEMCVQFGESVWLGVRPSGRGLQESMELGNCDIAHAHAPSKDPWDSGICKD
jgi:hypothetical protein